VVNALPVVAPGTGQRQVEKVGPRTSCRQRHDVLNRGVSLHSAGPKTVVDHELGTTVDTLAEPPLVPFIVTHLETLKGVVTGHNPEHQIGPRRTFDSRVRGNSVLLFLVFLEAHGDNFIPTMLQFTLTVGPM